MTSRGVVFYVLKMTPGIWVFPKNRGKTPKMDGENNGKPQLKMDDLGGKPTILDKKDIRHLTPRHRKQVDGCINWRVS